VAVTLKPQSPTLPLITILLLRHVLCKLLVTDLLLITVILLLFPGVLLHLNNTAGVKSFKNVYLSGGTMNSTSGTAETMNITGTLIINNNASSSINNITTTVVEQQQ
jgi:hypothetical protein